MTLENNLDYKFGYVSKEGDDLFYFAANMKLGLQLSFLPSIKIGQGLV